MSSQEEQVTRKDERREHVRLSEPRITPLESEEFVKLRDMSNEILKSTMNKSKWEKLEQTLAETEKKLTPFLGKNVGGLNVGRTIARNKNLFLRYTPIGVHLFFISSLPERDREILILRIGWLCYSEYEWGWHALGGKTSGLLSDDEISRVMEGPDSEEWDPFDATLLRAVDELFIDAFLTEKIWNALSERYNTHQLMDLVFTVGFYNMLAMALNSFGVQQEEGLKILKILSKVMSNQEGQLIRKMEPLKHVRLSEPRIPLLEKDEYIKVRVKAWEILKKTLDKSEFEKLVQKGIEGYKPLIPFLGGSIDEAPKYFPILNHDSTMAKNRDLYIRLVTLKTHIMVLSSLPERDREILILRIAWLCYSKYEWDQHALQAKAGGLLSYDEISRIMEGPDTEGWEPFDVTLLRAVDELYTDAFLTEEIWNVLSERYNTHQLMDLVFTVGFYNMYAMALNSFGVQLDEGLKPLIENLKIPKLK